MMPPPDLSQLTEAEKDTLILALWTRVAELEARLNAPPKTPGTSSLPPSRGHKANRPEKARLPGPRRGSLGREGGGRALAEEPDQRVIARATACAHCGAVLDDTDQVLHARYDKIDLPPVRPVVTRVERYRGHCPCCGGTTLAPVPEGLEEGSPFGPSILALALYLRFTHAISYRRLTRLFLHLFALRVSEGALDAMFRRAKRRFDDEAAAILARRRRARVICSDETTPRCASTAGPTGTGCSGTIRSSSTSSGRPAAGRWWRSCWAAIARRSGSPTCSAPSAATPTPGRSAWRTSCATGAMLSRRATPSSPRA
jgi:transposase